MNHSMAVSTNKRKVVYMGFMADCESGNRFRMMTLDKAIATFAIGN